MDAALWCSTRLIVSGGITVSMCNRPTCSTEVGLPALLLEAYLLPTRERERVACLLIARESGVPAPQSGEWRAWSIGYGEGSSARWRSVQVKTGEMSPREVSLPHPNTSYPNISPSLGIASPPPKGGQA